MRPARQVALARLTDSQPYFQMSSFFDVNFARANLSSKGTRQMTLLGLNRMELILIVVRAVIIRTVIITSQVDSYFNI